MSRLKKYVQLLYSSCMPSREILIRSLKLRQHLSARNATNAAKL